MRAFKLLLLLCIISMVLAQEAQPDMGCDKSDPVTAYKFENEMKEVSTSRFCVKDGTFREPHKIEGGVLSGMIIGFTCTGIFLVGAAILIIYDEIKRHEMYGALIEKDKKKLVKECNYTDEKMKELEEEFKEAERTRNEKIDAKAAAKDLSAIN